MEKQKADELWMFFMRAGEKMGCHQMPERSFFIGGFQFPVCARCTGVLLGYVTALAGYPKFHRKKFANKLGFILFGCDSMLIDWTLQFMGVKKSTNFRRLITGFLGGMGIMTVYMDLIKSAVILLTGRKNRI